MLNEVIRTSGDVRRLIAETMQGVKNGTIDVSKATAIASLAKELTGSLQAEVNVVKANLALRKEGITAPKIAHMGKLLISDDSVPTLDGTSSD